MRRSAPRIQTAAVAVCDEETKAGSSVKHRDTGWWASNVAFSAGVPFGKGAAFRPGQWRVHAREATCQAAPGKDALW